MNAASIGSEYEWRTIARERPGGLEVIFLKRTDVLPRSQFLYAEGGDDEIRLVFATQDVVVTGTGLSPMLGDLAEQRIGRLNEPTRAERLDSFGTTRIQKFASEKPANTVRE